MQDRFPKQLETDERPLHLMSRRGISVLAKARVAIAAIVVGGVPYYAFSAVILYHFYERGGVSWDSGLLAFLMSERNPSLPTPQFFGGESFFATHFSPIFIVLAWIRRTVPVTDVQFFADFTGVCHALCGLAVLWILYSGLRMRTSVAVAIAALISLAFSFNGLALAIVRYPHFEILIVGTALLFFVALIRQHIVIAGSLFAVCLATREDAGFHLFAVLALWIALNRYRGISWRAQRSLLSFAMVSLAYSIAALLLQHCLFPGQSSFARIYLGNPPFGKISLAVLSERLLGYVQYRAYLVLPALVALLWAVRVRNPFIVLGYAAFIPWAILHLFADSAIASTLSSYYAFPFMIASFWPLVAVVIEAPSPPGGAYAAISAFPFVAMIAASYAGVAYQANPGSIPLPSAFLSAPSIARQQATQQAAAAIARSRAALGTVLVDDSILALDPASFTLQETVWAPTTPQPDTVIYFAEGYKSDVTRSVATTEGLNFYYRLRGTSIRLATDRLIESTSLGALLVRMQRLE